MGTDDKPKLDLSMSQEQCAKAADLEQGCAPAAGGPPESAERTLLRLCLKELNWDDQQGLWIAIETILAKPDYSARAESELANAMVEIDRLKAELTMRQDAKLVVRIGQPAEPTYTLSEIAKALCGAGAILEVEP